jgi:hypothetical protein
MIMRSAGSAAAPMIVTEISMPAGTISVCAGMAKKPSAREKAVTAPEPLPMG